MKTKTNSHTTGPPPDPDRPARYDLAAERAVLGSMLRLNAVIGDVVQLVRAEDFSGDHSILFRAIVALWDKGKPVDCVTLADVLKNRGELDDIGSYPAIAELWDVAPTAAHATHYAGIVREESIRRQLWYAGAESMRLANDRQGLADEALAEAERGILAIAEVGSGGNTIDLTGLVSETYQRIDTRQAMEHGELSGVDTGYIDLNRLTSGWQRDELIVLAGRPSSGKTALSLNFLLAAIRSKARPFFVSLEQSRAELMERLLCCAGSVDSHRLRRGLLDSTEMDRLMQAGDELRAGRAWFDDTACQTMLRIAANARRLRQRQQIGLVIIDYLQLIEPDDRKAPRQEQVASISRRLKGLARELHIPVMALAQLNRDLENRPDHRPRLSDLRESGAVEQDADIVAFTHRPEQYAAEPGKEPERPGEIDVIIGKQRNGPTGDVTLVFRKEYMRFENFAAPAFMNPFGEK